MNRFYLLPLVFLLGSGFSTLSAQEAPRLQGEFLISLDEKTNAIDFASRLDVHASVEKVSDLLNVWLLRSTLPEQTALNWLRRRSEVRSVQFNHILEERSHLEDLLLPDDPLFIQQWHLLNDGSDGGVFDADLDAEQAWNISSGGLTPAGDTIVLAVIDGGLQAVHNDLAANIRRNWDEVPQNGVDDDANGYVDDFWGWNVFTQNDHIQGGNTEHGTPVCGILGARGNNGIGISGVNWQTKIMFVSANGTEAAILSAFDYVWKERKRYNATLGNQGAFVVAVNCSWGINFGQPEDAPIWCAAFDSLGAAGIVSVAATANIPVNIDEVGDLPTACPSNYLISVTSLDRSDVKVETAAWGQQHVDIGAYGKEVVSTGANGGYGAYTGTSFAAPQVTGLIGLLYAAPCPNLIALTKNNPQEAAYWVKSLVLENPTPNLSLNGRTSTGGRLNLFNVLRSYQNQCSDCPPPFALKSEQISSDAALLLWT
ncbi:MAG: S8 family serine peptidase, partial [Saprospiraceae bacterium]|nr:S8 family serine peptidase [Saprospiraceae bacterium]